MFEFGSVLISLKNTNKPASKNKTKGLRVFISFTICNVIMEFAKRKWAKRSSETMLPKSRTILISTDQLLHVYR